MSKVFSSLGRNLSIDMGSINTHVYVEGRGIVVSEPSLVATDTKQEGIIAVGSEAERLLLRTPDMLDALRPLKDGFIVDYRVTHTMLNYFIHKASKSVRRSRVFMSIPCGMTDVEQRAMTDAVIQAGAREVYLLETPVLAALGSGLPIFDSYGSMAVDIGGGTVDIGILALGGTVISRSVRCGGGDFNAVILQYIKQCFSVMVADDTVEEIKCTLATALMPEEDLEYTFLGRDTSNGLMKRSVIHSYEIYEVLQEPICRIINEIKNVIRQTSPELVADIMENGMVLTGGSAQLTGLAECIAKEIGIPVHVPDNPSLTVARGLGVAAKQFSMMTRYIVASKNRKGRI
ncbi:rod shape-determining protein [Veillonella montpellierensis]|uniref:rod shape-determining protein n=1 Tax=Veillonella montpellierensis TaxID=187328 RepID=UPI0023F96781|nr:rod shape-determining protein [Veillonella montpellierensis]